MRLRAVKKLSVTLGQHSVIARDGTEMVSESVLCFRRQAQVAESLADSSLVVEEIRQAL
jgi:hypothetical protein